jgi:rod shape-determining protein MreC
MASRARPFKQRNAAVLIVLIVAALGLMIVQIQSPGKVSTASRWTLAVFAPFFEAGAWSSKKLTAPIRWALSSQAALEENRRIKQDLAQARSELSLAQEQLANLKRQREFSLSPLQDIGIVLLEANVIAISSQQWTYSIVVDRGKLRGVIPDPPMPAIDYASGVVGMATDVGSDFSLIRLLCDPGFTVGSMIVSSRAHGIVKGLGRTDRLRFWPSDQETSLEPGMEIISSGLAGSPYPKGLRIGTVSDSGSDEYGMPYANIVPAANFDRIEELFLLDTQKMTLPVPEEAGPVELEAETGEEVPDSTASDDSGGISSQPADVTLNIYRPGDNDL